MSGNAGVFAAPAAYDPTHLAWTAAFLAWVLAVPMYLVSRFIGVVAHEGGHAIIATLLFRRVSEVRVFTSGGGVTRYEAPSWLFEIAIKAAGYLGPSMFGLLAVKILLQGAVETVLWTSLVFLLLMLFVVRGPVGLIVVPALMVVIVLVMTRTHPPLQVLYTHMWVWFLLIAPVEEMLGHISRKVYAVDGADTAELGKITPFPAEIWSLAMLAGTGAALVYGASLLLGHAG